MKSCKVTMLVSGVILLSGVFGFAQERRVADSLLSQSNDRFYIAAYGGIAGGATFIQGSILPSASSSGGLRFSSWFSLGAFVEGLPLSDFEHASFGLHAADRQNAYMLSSGTELLFTPFASSVLHPLFRVALGGSSVGYLENTDGEEGFDKAREQRYFFAAAVVGLELNLHRCWVLTAHIGGRFVGNGDTLGIAAGHLSGLEAGVGVRVLYGIIFE